MTVKGFSSLYELPAKLHTHREITDTQVEIRLQVLCETYCYLFICWLCWLLLSMWKRETRLSPKDGSGIQRTLWKCLGCHSILGRVGICDVRSSPWQQHNGITCLQPSILHEEYKITQCFLLAALIISTSIFFFSHPFSHDTFLLF